MVPQVGAGGGAGGADTHAAAAGGGGRPARRDAARRAAAGRTSDGECSSHFKQEVAFSQQNASRLRQWEAETLPGVVPPAAQLRGVFRPMSLLFRKTYIRSGRCLTGRQARCRASGRLLELLRGDFRPVSLLFRKHTCSAPTGRPLKIHKLVHIVSTGGRCPDSQASCRLTSRCWATTSR